MNPVSPLQDRRDFAISVMLAINLYLNGPGCDEVRRPGARGANRLFRGVAYSNGRRLAVSRLECGTPALSLQPWRNPSGVRRTVRPMDRGRQSPGSLERDDRIYPDGRR